MPTTISVSSFQTACAAVADAVDSEDWDTAYKKYAKAEAIHSGLEVHAGDQGSYVRRRETLDGLKRALDAARAATLQIGEHSRFVRTRTTHG